MAADKEVILEARHVGFSYQSGGRSRDQSVLSDVSFSGRAGDCVAIMGRSGIGKTTLCRILAGLLAPQKGTVLVRGKQLRKPSTLVTIAFQDSPCFPWLTAYQNVAFALRGQDANIAESLVRDLKLQNVRAKFPKELSGGMKQRVAIGRALAVSPACLILDEPFSALDIVTKGQLQDLLRTEQSNRDLLVLIVLHSLEDALAVANRLLVLGSSPAHIVLDIAVDEDADYREIRNKITAVLAQAD